MRWEASTGRPLTPTLSPRRGIKSGRTFEGQGRCARVFSRARELKRRDAGRLAPARQPAVAGIGWGCGRVAGGGNWVGVKGELSLASPNPQRGFGLARDSLGRIFWRVGEEGWGREGAAGRREGRRGRGPGEGVGWGGRERKRPVSNWPLRKMGNKRERRRGVRGARSRRRRASMEVPREGRGIEGVPSVHGMLTRGKGGGEGVS